MKIGCFLPCARTQENNILIISYFDHAKYACSEGQNATYGHKNFLNSCTIRQIEIDPQQHCPPRSWGLIFVWIVHVLRDLTGFLLGIPGLKSKGSSSTLFLKPSFPEARFFCLVASIVNVGNLRSHYFLPKPLLASNWGDTFHDTTLLYSDKAESQWAACGTKVALWKNKVTTGAGVLLYFLKWYNCRKKFSSRRCLNSPLRLSCRLVASSRCLVVRLVA